MTVLLLALGLMEGLAGCGRSNPLRVSRQQQINATPDDFEIPAPPEFEQTTFEQPAPEEPGGVLPPLELLEEEEEAILPLPPQRTFFTLNRSIAVGDINRNGKLDTVTGSLPGEPAEIRIFFDGSAQAQIVLRPYGAFVGEVFVALGDVNGDQMLDIVTGAGKGGGPHVKVFSGVGGVEFRSFFAYDSAFTGGVRVAVGDTNRDGFADIITGAGEGGGPHVKVFDGRSNGVLQSFFAYDPKFTGGIYVASGDLNQDGIADIITGAGVGGGPHVRGFNGSNPSGVRLADYFAYDSSFHGGVRVSTVSPDQFGVTVILTSPGPGYLSSVTVYDPRRGSIIGSMDVPKPSPGQGLYISGNPEL